jgi:hypothetical protein
MSRFTSVARVALLFGVAYPVTSSGQARPAPATTSPAKTLEEGWEQTDQRLVFLTSQLSSVEASLRAVSKAIAVTGYKQQVQADKVGAARLGNELMDRKGGAPVPWDQFYGKTARHFAVGAPPGNYSIKYKGPATDISYPTNDPLRRPKQFDFLYRANAETERRAESEAAALGGKVELLLARRRQLEAEQSALWCKIAFQLIEGRDLAAKPLYHFGLIGAEGADAERVEALRALARFARVAQLAAGQAVEWVESDQARAFADLRKNLAAARADLKAMVLTQPRAAVEAADSNTELSKALTLANRMDDMARNVSDASRLALSRDQAGDEQQKETFRGALQESVLNYAAAVLKLDDTVSQLAQQWQVAPDSATPAPPVALSAAAEPPPPPTPPIAPQLIVLPVATPDEPKDKGPVEVKDKPQAELRDKPHAEPAIGVKPVGILKPVEVAVSALNNQANTRRTGVRVARGQVFLITPDPAGRWSGGGSKTGKTCDYRGYFPNKNDPWMKMYWRVGTTTTPVISNQPITAPADGEIELLCWDGKVDGNSGEIRVAIELQR